MTHPPHGELRAILHAAAGSPPGVDHTIEEVRHRVWTLSEGDSATVAAMLADATVYVTDGHHRTAAALAARYAYPDDPALDRMLAVLFPADELRVEAFHRRAPDYDRRELDELCAGLGTVGSVEPVTGLEAAAPRRRGEVGVYAQGHWFRLCSIHSSDPPRWRRSTWSGSGAT